MISHSEGGEGTVGNPHRAQIVQFELFELFLFMNFGLRAGRPGLHGDEYFVEYTGVHWWQFLLFYIDGAECVISFLVYRLYYTECLLAALVSMVPNPIAVVLAFRV